MTTDTAVAASPDTGRSGGSFTDRLGDVVPILREHARRVDDDAAFPTTSLDALRRSGLMGLLVPRRFGGLGGGLDEMVAVAVELGGACMSTAMIWTMHCQQVATIAAHGAPELREDLLPRVARGEVYIASVTSERGKGGHLLTADAALDVDADRVVISRDAPIVTGGTVADGFLITMRTGGDASSDDVSLVYADRAEVTVTEGDGSWNPMGMRGTHSSPITLSGSVDPSHIVGGPGGFRSVATKTFIPTGHIGWAASWLGGARAALGSVLEMLRNPKTRGQFDLNSELLRRRLAGARIDVDTMAALLTQVVRDSRSGTDPESVPVQLRLNGLKVHTADRSHSVIDGMIELVGLRHGYMRDASLPLERLYRDLRSASLNYSNDRLLDANGALALLDRTVTLAW